MATMTVLDSVGGTQTVEKPLVPGRAAAALSRPVVLSTEDLAAINAIATALAGSLTVTGTFYPATQAVSNAGTFAVQAAQSGTWNITNISGSISLPTGAASAANQTALNALFPASLGTKTAANSLAVTLASDGQFVASIGAPADTSATTDTGTFSLIALFKRALGYLSTIATAAADTVTASPVSVQTPADVITVTPTLDTSIYASGEVLFATTAIPGVTRANDLRAVLMSLAVIDKDDQKPAFTILFFQSNVTSGAFNGAPSISDADAANYLGHVDIVTADYRDLGGVSVVCYKGINLLLEAVAGGTTVYAFGLLNAGSPTHTAGGLVLKLGVVQS